MHSRSGCPCTNSNTAALVANGQTVPRIPLYASASLQYSGISLPGGGNFDAVDIINANAPIMADFRDHPSPAIPLVFGAIAAALACVAGTFIVKNRKSVTRLGSGELSSASGSNGMYLQDLGTARLSLNNIGRKRGNISASDGPNKTGETYRPPANSSQDGAGEAFEVSIARSSLSVD